MPVRPGDLRDEEFELRLSRFEIHPVHHVPTYQFLMFHLDTGEELGNIRLSIGSTFHLELYAGHIGYGVLPQSIADITTPPAPSACCFPLPGNSVSIQSGSPATPRTSPRAALSNSPVPSLSRSSMSPRTASFIATGTLASAATGSR